LIISVLEKYENINLHINYLEPGAFLLYIKDLDKRYVDRIKFMNIPLQSLSQKLLDKMNRKYNGQYVINEIKKFRNQYKNTKIVTQMIY
jgi:tRNA A37 methylthiotransferase MiaB